jgi:hypothetical protein
MFITNGTIVESPIFYRLADSQDGGAFVGLLAGIGTGVAVAETALAVGAIGGSSLVGTAAGAVAAGVAAVGSSVIIGAVVVGATLFAITNNANASEPVPPGTPLPPGTPQSNPTPDPEPQVPTPVNPCLTNGVNVTVGVDPGNELVAIATGGTGGPYTFSWSTGATATAGTFTTLTPGQPGTYSVSVIDGNGCAAAGSATIGEGVGECILCATNFGEYSWSNGSSSSCITVNEPGTYTVTVSDTLLPQPINEQFTVLGVVGALECPE